MLWADPLLSPNALLTKQWSTASRQSGRCAARHRARRPPDGCQSRGRGRDASWRRGCHKATVSGTVHSEEDSPPWRGRSTEAATTTNKTRATVAKAAAIGNRGDTDCCVVFALAAEIVHYSWIAHQMDIGRSLGRRHT